MNYAPVNQGMIVPAAGNTQTTDCIPGGAVALERVRYFNRQLLTAEDMTTEQNYFLQKLRLQNEFPDGRGVVCGLGVTPVADSGSALASSDRRRLRARPLWRRDFRRRAIPGRSCEMRTERGHRSLRAKPDHWRLRHQYRQAWRQRLHRH